MIKQILKEIIIILFLILAILLILSVLFYDYNPTNKVLPNKIEYKAPENIKEELQEATEKDETLEVEGRVYTVEGTDLNLYKKSNTYNPSKQNPYANTSAGSSTTVPQNNNNSSGTGTSSNNQNTTNTNTKTNSTVTTPKTGLK